MTRTSSRRSAHRTRRTAIGIGVAALALAGLSSCRPAPEVLTVTPVVNGLDRPWDLAFTPAGDLLFTERVGRIKVRTTAGTIRTLATPTDAIQAGEGGMMGLAVDPAFASNRRIYTCFLSNKDGARDVRLVRWRVNEAQTALTDRAELVTGLPYSSGRHSGCRPRFGPDGNLWMGTGDAAIGTIPQDPTSLGGKVLRVDTNGAAVPGNAPAPFDPRIYSYGHRNVQGIAFSPTGQAYSIEHGSYRDDEVNALVSGGNYGWDPTPIGGGTSYDESRPMTDTARHPGSIAAVWSSGTSTIAPSGGTFLTGTQWKGWKGALAMAVLKDHQLRVIGLKGDTTTFEQQWTALADSPRLRVAVQGPDGDLWLATDANPGQILKVTPSDAPDPEPTP